MATKPLKSIVVTTIGGGTVNAADTVSAPAASVALSEFEAFKTMHIKGENDVTLVPFHAVDRIVVTTTQSSDIPAKDPYGCE